MKNILIVDDDPVSVKIIETILTSMKYTFTSYTNPLIALENAKSQKYDIAIIDFEMPEINGIILGQNLRKLYGESFMILMLTAHEEIEILEQAIEAGINDFFTKPISVNYLKARISIMAKTLENVQKKLEYQNELNKTQDHYRAIFDNSAVGVMVFDMQGNLLEANLTFSKMLGYPILKESREFILQYTHPDDREKLYIYLKYFIQDKKSYGSFFTRYISRSGLIVWTKLSISLVTEGEDHKAYLIIIVEDITEAREYEEELKYYALHDSLTGLPNRNLFLDRLDNLIWRSSNLKNDEREVLFTLVILDIDRFQIINETLGHTLGDELIKSIAERLQKGLSTETTIARMTGDEFAILTEEYKTIQNVNLLIKKIKNLFQNSFFIHSHEITITASLGIKCYTGELQSKSEILRDADTALHRAKQKGINGFEFFTKAMNAESKQALRLENDLRKSLLDGGFELYFQPQLNIKKNQISGAEALIRWNHPTDGLLLPKSFIPLAEKIGLSSNIGKWVIEEAIQIAHKWEKNGLGNLNIAINLSPNQISDHTLIPILKECLSKFPLVKNTLTIELTENVLLHTPDLVIATLQEIKNLGIKLAIDDFGTGYSSLSYFKTLPIDYIKIDKSFIDNILESESDKSIILAINALAHSMRKITVAEGVESKEQLDLLVAMHVDSIQGYFISYPLPENQLLSFLDNYNKNKNFVN